MPQVQDYKSTLIEVLGLTSYSGRETKVSDYVTKFCENNGIDVYSDMYGNVYATKGVAEHYPCVVSHMDTVHPGTDLIVKEDVTLGILYGETSDGKPEGIGGDDKAGVFVCLQLLLHCDVLKAAFFVAEEVGCLGSYLSDETFFVNVGYAIQFDAPEVNWVSAYSDGERLFEMDSEFFRIVESVFLTDMPKYSRTVSLGYHPYTDVSALKRLYNFSCINYSVGYYRMHTKHERVVIKDVLRCLEIAKKQIALLGNNLYHYPHREVLAERFKRNIKERLFRLT